MVQCPHGLLDLFWTGLAGPHHKPLQRHPGACQHPRQAALAWRQAGGGDEQHGGGHQHGGGGGRWNQEQWGKQQVFYNYNVTYMTSFHHESVKFHRRDGQRHIDVYYQLKTKVKGCLIVSMGGFG